MSAKFDAATLQEITKLKVELHDDRYEIEPIVGGGYFLYDPQVFWDWDSGYKGPWAGPDGSILISEIGGQPQPTTDWRMGHGGLYRLHADNHFETLMAPGSGRQCGVFRPMIAPPEWGQYSGHMFFCSQIAPHRRGAVMDHLVYRLAPGDDKPEVFCIPPRSGTRGGGVSGALLPGVFGRPGTPEAGLFLFFSMHNCTVYAARPDGSVEPYIVLDGQQSVMPYRLFYADNALVGEKNMLVVAGKWGSAFGEQSTRFEPGHYRINARTVDPQNIKALAGGPGHRAPKSFGPLAGDSFRPENNGFISSVHWTEGDVAQPLPYTSEIRRRDADGREHVFASKLQAGQNLIGFCGNRMIVTNMGHSYSTGNFKYPDGTVFAIRFKG